MRRQSQEYIKKEELQTEVKAILSEYEKKYRKWYCLFAIVLLVILTVTLYVGISLNRWGGVWALVGENERIKDSTVIAIDARLRNVETSFSRWDSIWVTRERKNKLKELQDKAAMKLYLKDRETWLNDSLATKSRKR